MMKSTPTLDRTASHSLPASPEETEQASARLLRAEFLAMSRLAAGVAYELENPLGRLLVRLRALSESGVALGQPLDSAIAAAEHVDATVRGLRAFTRVDESPLGVDVHEAIELAVHLAMPELTRRARVQRTYGPVGRVRGNLGRLTLVLLNVLRNAAAAMPSGMAHTNTISIHTGWAEEGTLSIDVVDTGFGIEPEDLALIFDPFFTTKASSEAPGLGLAAARAAMLEMGGRITAESIVGRGSTFTLTLAAAEPDDRGLMASILGEIAPAHAILCVADSPSDAERLGAMIDDEDARFVFATCDDAIARISTGEPYDLILCDSRADRDAHFRERLARVMPDAVGRVFTMAPRGSSSGTFSRLMTVGRTGSGTDGR